MLAQQRIQDLERCCYLGTIGITDPLGTESDDEALRNFNENVKFRYQVILPWKSGCEELPDNYNVAVMRLKSLLIRFQVDKKLLQNYKNSLNDCLYRGPIILPDLCGLLLRFRLYPIIVLADIKKAFLQVGLQEKERSTTRFLWLKDTTT